MNFHSITFYSSGLGCSAVFIRMMEVGGRPEAAENKQRLLLHTKPLVFCSDEFQRGKLWNAVAGRRMPSLTEHVCVCVCYELQCTSRIFSVSVSSASLCSDSLPHREAVLCHPHICDRHRLLSNRSKTYIANIRWKRSHVATEPFIFHTLSDPAVTSCHGAGRPHLTTSEPINMMCTLAGSPSFSVLSLQD